MSGSCSYGPGLAVSSDEGRILYLLPSVNTNESQRMVHICLAFILLFSVWPSYAAEHTTAASSFLTPGDTRVHSLEAELDTGDRKSPFHQWREAMNNKMCNLQFF